MKKAEIRLMNHTGDQVMAVFDSSTQEGCKVGQDALTKFLGDCVKQYGSTPAVWIRRSGEQSHVPLRRDADSPLQGVDEVLLHYPMRGG